MATTTRKHSRALAQHVERRLTELRMSPTEFARAAGVSLPGLKPLRDGERRNYSVRLKGGATKALRWTPDSIDRILDGQEPVDIDKLSRRDITRLDGIEARLDELEGLAKTVIPQVTANAVTLAEVQTMLEALGRALRPLIDPWPAELELMPGLAP